MIASTNSIVYINNATRSTSAKTILIAFGNELDSIITRVGEGCRVIFCGDFRQADLIKNGLRDFIRVIKAMNCFDIVDFEINDIVRSNFVKEYIIAKEQLGL